MYGVTCYFCDSVVDNWMKRRLSVLQIDMCDRFMCNISHRKHIFSFPNTTVEWLNIWTRFAVSWNGYFDLQRYVIRSSFYAGDVNNNRVMGQKVVCHNLLINRTALLYMCIYFVYKISGYVVAICENEICVRFYKEKTI